MENKANINPQIESSWLEILNSEFKKEYFKSIKDYLLKEKELKKKIYPAGSLIFNAFNLTPFDKVKVVILGQDPYHQFGQAHGLAFSVPFGIRTPPSLLNIYKELKNEFGAQIPNHGNLEHWASQGVLLLNTSLTVRDSEAASHSKIGWQIFTDEVIKSLSNKRENLVFILWGAHAGSKLGLINQEKHFVIQSVHPSPLSAERGFFGSKPFSKCNAYLKNKGIEEIVW